MKFGQVKDPEKIDFTLPRDAPDTRRVLTEAKNSGDFEVYVGCAKWNRTDLKGFYPRGTKDELAYYATQFNSIELNATFYHAPSREQVAAWRDKTPEEFRFYPKIPNTISHFRRLQNIKQPLTQFCDAISRFEDRLGITFLQLHDNFGPKNIDRLIDFTRSFPKGIPLAVEVRNEAWVADPEAGKQFFELMEKEKMTAVIVDTAGRRDLLHMRLTSPAAFIRYVGANDPTDYSRLDDWIKRIGKWRREGLQSVHFFVHQNIEKESPLLSAYFIKELNKAFGLELKIPATLG